MSDFYTRRDRVLPLAQSILSLREQVGSIIGIYPHLRADGDAYGASFSLARVLRKLGIEAYAVLNEGVDRKFSYLEGKQFSIDWSSLTSEEQQQFIASQTMSIMVDLSVLERLEKRQEAYCAAEDRRILDHHISALENNQNIFIYPDAAASCELVFDLVLALEKLSQEKLLDHAVALGLYTGILTDTGNFSFSNVTPYTMYVGSILLSHDINLPRLTDHLFRLEPWSTFYSEGYLRTQVQSACDGKIHYLSVSKDLMSEIGAREEDIEQLPGKMRSIRGTLCSLMLRESEHGEIRGNLRSIPRIDIRQVAEKFGGGGHRNAAGFTMKGVALAEAEHRVLEVLVRFIEEHGEEE